MITKLFVHANSRRPDGSFDTFSTIEVEAKEAPLWWQLKGLSFTRAGYGSRIPTSIMVRYNGKWRRVYCAIWSNSGTCYIGKNMTGSEVLLVRDY